MIVAVGSSKIVRVQEEEVRSQMFFPVPGNLYSTVVTRLVMDDAFRVFEVMDDVWMPVTRDSKRIPFLSQSLIDYYDHIPRF
jgi:hypothetical protein